MPKPQVDIGILGGGQLARMLAMAAHRMGLRCLTLVETDNDPAAQVGPHQIGSISKSSDLRKFFKSCRFATFESEFVDTKKISDALKGTNCKVLPKLKTMERFRDRLSQKKTFDQYQLPTSPWNEVNSYEKLKEQWQKSQTLVIKKRLMGYDGYGTSIIRDASNLNSFWTLNSKNLRDPGFISENWIGFDRELAFSLARNAGGDCIQLPWVETHQESSRCLWVRGPVHITERMQGFAEQARRLLNEVEYIGLITFEVFDAQGEIWLNETAPRVHNSAHYSLDALSLDQFELHLRCVLNLPLPTLSPPESGFAMWNLLGQNQKKIDLLKLNSKLSTGCRLHWYGKGESRPGRKLGHINALAADAESALHLAKNAAAHMGF